MKIILAISLCIQLVFASDPWDGFEGGIGLGGGHGGGGFSLSSLGGGGHGGGLLSSAFILPIPEIGLTLSKIPILLPIPTIILRARKELVSKPSSIPISSHGSFGHGGFSIGSFGGGFGHGGGGWWRRR